MPRYSYTARQSTGQTVSATLEAPTRKDALRLLTARGLTPQRVDESTSPGKATSAKARPAAKSKPAALQPVRKTGPVTLGPRDQLPFLQALYDLTTSGLSAGESIRLLSIRIQEPRLRTICIGLWERLSEGAQLSGALAAYPQIFSPSTLNLINAGEATGNLNDVLSRLTTYLTEQKEMRRQLLTALAYPIFMVGVSFLVVLFFLFFLLPRLQVLLTSLGGKLPLSTQLLVGTADFLLKYGIFIAIAVAFGLTSFWRWRKTAAGRATTDQWLLSLPLVGPFLINQTVLMLSQTLSVLLENGITAAEALRMTERQLTNVVHRAAFSEAIDRVIEGESLSKALAHTNFLPPLTLDQLAIGENTGNIVPSLKKISRNTQGIVSYQLNAFTKVISTAVLMSVFIFVGFIAFSIVQAVFTLSSSFSK